MLRETLCLVLLAAPAWTQNAQLRFVRTLPEPPRYFGSSAFNVRGDRLAVGLPDGSVRIWSTDTGAAPETIQVSSGVIRALAFAPDGTLFVGGPADVKTVKSGAKPVIQTVPGLHEAKALAVSNGAVAIASANSKDVQVISRKDGATLRRFQGHSSQVLGLSFSPDGERLAAGEFFRISRMWSMRCNCPQQIFPNQSSDIAHLSFSPDGRLLLAVSESGIQISDVTSGVELQRIYPASGSILAASFANDGSIAALIDDGGLGLWRSEPLQIEAARRRPVLYMLAIGINVYRDPALHLGFAQQDASDLATAFEQSSQSLLYEPRATRILGDCATRTEILTAMDEIAAMAKPEDAVMVFLAGHGREDRGDFWFYTHRFQRSDPLPGEALPASEIAQRLEAMRAGKQILIVDACQSGSATERIRRMFERTAQTKRQFQVLSASAATEEAMEAEDLGHGLLTSALLDSLKRQIASGQAMTAGAWLGSAAAKVPAFASQYNISGSQKPDWKAFGADFGLIEAQRRAAPVSTARRAPARPGIEAAAKGQDTFHCSPTASDRRFVRPEGLTEMAGDLIFRCSGKVTATTLSIQVFFNSNFTGRPDAQGRPDTFLLVEPPGTRSDVNTAQPIRGKLASNNSMRFDNVPIPVVDGKVDSQFRITGLRVSANQLGLSSTLVTTQMMAYYKVEAPGIPSLTQTQAVAYILGPLTWRIAGCGAGSKSPAVLSNSASENESLATGADVNGAIQFSVRFVEGNPENFLPAGKGPAQRLPNGVALVADAPDRGTRLRIALEGVPPGMDVYATLRPVPALSSAAARASLVNADLTGAGPFEKVKGNAAGLCGGVSLPVAKLKIEGSRAQAVWEVTGSDPNVLDTFAFGLMVAYRARTAPGSATITADYAPVSTKNTSDPVAPIPRFAPVSMRRTLFTVEQPVP